MAGCSENCKCRPGVIALVFIPGIMGTRLRNSSSKKNVWDPGAGAEFEGSSGAMIETQKNLETAATQINADDSSTSSLNKWFYQQKLEAEGRAETGRSINRVAGLVGTISDLVFAGPKERKKLLVTENKKSGSLRDDKLLEVDDGTDNYFNVFTSVEPSQIEKKRNRGWGEVYWDSYGPFLKYLEQKEKVFNKLYPGISMPVFAVGYNWMLSNEESGKRIKKRLAEFKKQILEEDQRGIQETDIKFIIISHSMGGFASRAGIILSELGSQVEAVIHGAMPTHGSPATYVQMRAGQRNSFVSSLVLGKNAADMTAILAFCQGGLELLPNQLYTTVDNKKEWLFYNNQQGKGNHVALPVQYSSQIYDFYQDTDHWYSMITPRLLAPELEYAEFTDEVKETYLDAYKERIMAVKRFHQRLADHFHPTTCLIYSNSAEFKSYDRAIWCSKGQPEGESNYWKTINNQNDKTLFCQGTLELTSPQELMKYQQQYEKWSYSARRGANYMPAPVMSTITFTLKDPDVNGDGTVHQGAGDNPSSADGGLKKTAVNSSKGHQMFYNCPQVRELVLEQLQLWVKDIHDKMAN